MSRPSLYVHVPFCVVKCGYCDFNSYAIDDLTVVDRFLKALDRELASQHVPRQVPSVFIGGGTPTWLDPARFARLLEILRSHVDLASCLEVTIEANPESTTLEKARLAREAGVTRISIGAQSFTDERLRFLDRAHDAAGTRAAFQAARAAGFDNVSLDLIFGLPGQTLPEWERDLRAALELGPDHLSCYNLTFESGTRLERDRRRGLVAPNEDEIDRAMFLRTRELLSEHGFLAYEISNFAGRGGPCLHNEHYWQQGDYFGVGPGAARHHEGWRATNLKPIGAWCEAVELDLPTTAEAETLTREQRLNEALWLGLRRTVGIDLEQLEARLGLDPRRRHAATIAHYSACGWLTAARGRLALTAEGVLHADEVGAAFL